MYRKIVSKVRKILWKTYFKSYKKLTADRNGLERIHRENIFTFIEAAMDEKI